MEGRRIHLVEVLGEGAFGKVYRGNLQGPGGFTKSVAVKVLRPETEDMLEASTRFRDEARILGMLSHRSIVQVDGLYRFGDRWALVMEYVHGVGLDQLIRAGRVPPGPALEIVSLVAGALDAAMNAKGVDDADLELQHRDIKPSNIHITVKGEVKVLDFGIARAVFQGREAETRSLLLGSTGFMAPERFDQEDLPAGDVYSLGAVLFEMLTGEPLGRTSSNEQRHQKHLNKKLPIVVGLYGEGALTELLRRMLAFEPDARPLPRDLEHQAMRLGRDIPGPLLRYWAEEAVPPAREKVSRPPPDELTHTILLGSAADPDQLVAQPEAESVVAPVAPSRRYGLAGVGLVVGLLGFMLLLGLPAAGLLLWSLMGQSPEAPTALTPKAPSPSARGPAPTNTADSPPPSAQTQPSANAPLAEPVAPDTKRASEQRQAEAATTKEKQKEGTKGRSAADPVTKTSAPPRETAPATSAPPPPPVVEKGKVRMDGSFASAALTDSSGVTVPLHAGSSANVPAGPAHLSVTFTTGTTRGYDIKVLAGGTVTRNCDNDFEMCK